MRVALGSARLVPLGVQIPPPFRTKVEQAASSNVGMLATEGRDTPMPVHTPQPAAYDQRQQILNPGGSGQQLAAGASGAMAAGVMAPGASGGMAPGPGSMAGGTGVGSSAIGTGPNTGRGLDSVERPKKRALWPFAVVGIAAAGVGGFFIVKSMQASTPVTAPRDAAVAVHEPDAKQIAIAEPPPVIDAGKPEQKPDITDTMVHFAAGDHTLGEVKLPTPKALSSRTVAVPEFWIDREELTLGKLREALKDPKVGGDPKDTPEVAARFVTWAQAGSACKALGKRLPSEYEWEVAALSAPHDTSKAAMCTVCAEKKEPVLEPTKRTDCSLEGLCDMLGGVLEWTADAGANATRVVRGSSFAVAPDAGWLATVNARLMFPSNKGDNEIGFRCAYSRDNAPKIPTPPALSPTIEPKPEPKPKLPPPLPPTEPPGREPGRGMQRNCQPGMVWNPAVGACVKKRVRPGGGDPWSK